MSTPWRKNRARPRPTCSLAAELIDEKLKNLEWRGRPEGDDILLLCEALYHADAKVLERSARALGQYADAAAIEPLAAALRFYLGGSGRRYVSLGILFCLGVLVLVALAVWSFDASSILLFSSWVSLVVTAFHTMRARGLVIRALAESLAEISERNPQPELRQLVPELAHASLAVVQQSRATRAGLRAAAERIERSTHELKSLPIAAGASSAEARQLPRPAEAPGDRR